MIGRLITLTNLNRLLQRLQSQQLARPERFELPTPRFEAWCSIQLSYGRRPAIIGMHRIQVKLEGRHNGQFATENNSEPA